MSHLKSLKFALIVAFMALGFQIWTSQFHIHDCKTTHPEITFADFEALSVINFDSEAEACVLCKVLSLLPQTFYAGAVVVAFGLFAQFLTNLRIEEFQIASPIWLLRSRAPPAF